MTKRIIAIGLGLFVGSLIGNQCFDRTRAVNVSLPAKAAPVKRALPVKAKCVATQGSVLPASCFKAERSEEPFRDDTWRIEQDEENEAPKEPNLTRRSEDILV